MNRKQLGQLGEDFAAEHIRSAGLTVVDRNWRCSSGEIDLIAMDGESIVFIEVRTRTIKVEDSSQQRYGTVLEAITPRKQQQVKRIAEIYLYKKRLYNSSVRFDVVLIEHRNGTMQAKHITNAF